MAGFQHVFLGRLLRNYYPVNKATAFASAVALVGCAHLPNYVLPGPNPSGSSTPTPTPGPSSTPSGCATQAPTATVIIVIDSAISAASVAPYGAINGYTKLNPDGSFGNVATVINARSSDIIQFVNGENSAPATIYHSAVGFPGANVFPPPPYSFPSTTQQPIGSAITQLQWSTGRLAPLAFFSQTFTVSQGTYYFGDFDYYNLSNLRDVLVVSP